MESLSVTDESACEDPNTPAKDLTTTPAELLGAVYDELRQQAAAYLGRERADHTLQATALVHEAYVKIAKHSGVHFRDSTHFRAVAAQSMRQILVDHARRRAADRRGGGRVRLTMSDNSAATGPVGDVDVIGLHEALKNLAQLDPRKAQVVELRFFGGMTCPEVGQVLNVSIKTVESDWAMAKAWLRSQLAMRDLA